MPLWTIYHPVGAYSDDDKQSLVDAIVPLYPVLPKFYIGVVFQEVRKPSFYIGGMPADGFIRISVDHIARQFKDDEIRERWLKMMVVALNPFTVDRGFDWEVHVDETPPALWLIQGMRPPKPNSEAEKLWASEGRPLAY